MHARNRSRRVVVSVVTAAAAALWLGGLSGCSSTSGNTDADYVKVCKDPTTGQRVDDEKCSDDTDSSGSSSHPYWVYQQISRSQSVTAPRVGERVPSGYSDSKPPSLSSPRSTAELDSPGRVLLRICRLLTRPPSISDKNEL